MCSILLNKDKYKVPINHTTKNIKAYTKFLVTMDNAWKQCYNINIQNLSI